MNNKYSHNGGPIIIDVHPDDRMTYAQWHIRDYLAGIRTLKPDEVGIYSMILSLLYQEMGQLRDDDRFISGHCNCEIRYYRKIKTALLNAGKIFEAEGKLYNNRAMAEIAKFCEMQKRKREAAVLREQRKRETQETSLTGAHQEPDRIASGAPYARPTLVSSAPHEPVAYLSGNENQEKHNKINGATTTAVVRLCHDDRTAVPEPRIYTEEEEDKDKEVSILAPTPLIEVVDDVAYGDDLKPKSAARKPRKVGARLAEDWVLPKPWGNWAVDEFVCTADQVRREGASFKDYWIAKTGKDATKTDWFATWRNWVRNKKWRERKSALFEVPAGEFEVVPSIDDGWEAVRRQQRLEAQDD